MSKGNVMKSSTSNYSAALSLRSAFGLLADESGDITPHTLRRASQDMGLNYTEEEIADMIQEAGSTENGRVSLRSLVHMIRDYSEDFPNLSPDEIQREITSVSRGLTTIKDEEESEELNSDEKNDSSSARFDAAEEGSQPDHSGETGNKQRNFKREVRNGSSIPAADKPRASHSRDSHVAVHSLDEGVVTLIKMYIEDGDDSDSNNIENVERKEVLGHNKDTGVPTTPSPVSESQDTHMIVNREKNECTDNDFSMKSNESNGDKTGSRKKQSNSVNKDAKSNQPVSSRKKSISNTDKRVATISAERQGTNTPRESLAKRKQTHINRSRTICTTKRERTNTSPTKHDSTKNSPMNNDCRCLVKSRARQSPNVDSARGKVMPTRESPGVGGGYTSRMGIALKMSQLRVKQRLMYTMWRALYEEALKKAEANRKAMLLAKEKKKKPLRMKRSTQAVDK